MIGKDQCLWVGGAGNDVLLSLFGGEPPVVIPGSRSPPRGGTTRLHVSASRRVW